MYHTPLCLCALFVHFLPNDQIHAATICTRACCLCRNSRDGVSQVASLPSGTDPMMYCAPGWPQVWSLQFPYGETSCDVLHTYQKRVTWSICWEFIGREPCSKPTGEHIKGVYFLLHCGVVVQLSWAVFVTDGTSSGFILKTLIWRGHDTR